MPKGSKKRKAAKKMKEKEANISKPQGNDDLRSQDERDDGGEVGSPASQEHHDHHQQFNEGNEVSENREPPPVRSYVTENKSMEGFPTDADSIQKIGQEGDGDIVIERVLEIEDLESTNVSIEHIESSKESHDGNDGSYSSSSSSSSSSDDESRNFEKKSREEAYNSVLEATTNNNEVKSIISLSEEETKVTEKAPFGQADNNSVRESAPVVDMVEPVVSLSKVTHITENATVENSVVSDLKVNEEKLFPTSDEVIGVSLDVADAVSEKNEDKVFPKLDENVSTSSKLVGSETNVNEGKILKSSAASIAETSNGTQNIKDDEIPECSENQPLVASAPRVVQRTSWLSCCGLFDVITGTSR